MEWNEVESLLTEVKRLNARVSECEGTMQLMHELIKRHSGSLCAQQQALEGIHRLLEIAVQPGPPLSGVN